MKKLVGLFIILYGLLPVKAQSPAVVWQKLYGGSGAEVANSIKQTTDGGYIVAGYTTSSNGDITSNHGSYDYWVLKLDSAGALEWQKTYGGLRDDRANNIQQTADGGYIVVGVSESIEGDITNFRGDKDFWVVKLSADGTIEWQKKYGGDDKETAYSVKQTTDGGYIVAGSCYSYDNNILPVNGDVVGFHGFTDGWIIKLSSTGALEWQKCLGTTTIDNFLSIQQTTDGGYIAAGDHSSGNYWLVKLANNGDFQWEKIYADTDTAQEVIQTSDGGYIMVGDVVSQIGNATGHNYGVIKVNSVGDYEWRKDFGGDGFFDIAKSIQQTPEGGYIIAGVSDSSYSGNVTGPNNGQQDAWLVKITSTGVIQWQKCYGGTSYDGPSAIQRTLDGGYIMAGYAQSNTGNFTANHGGTDLWVVKLAPDSLGLETSELDDSSVLFTPNPADDKITFLQEVDAISIYNMAGELLLETRQKAKEINLVNLAKGPYLLNIQTPNGSYKTKLLKK